MPMKLSVGICRKVGQPAYGSLSASCSVELELSGSLLQDDIKAFQQQVRAAYDACRQAVNEELARSQETGGHSNGRDRPQQRAPSRTDPAGTRSNGNGSGGRQVTEKQIDYIQQLARQVKGLGIRRLETLSQKMFGKPIAALTSLDASGMIDTLKALKGGEINLDNALKGATP